MAEWPKRAGERVGHNWRLRGDAEVKGIRHVTFDTNWWKSFAHARLAVAMGDRGCLSLFGDKPDLHRMLADHLTAEYRVPVEARGRRTDEWKVRPERPDNHLFDCLVGACVAASMQGVVLTEARQRPAGQPKKRVSFSDMQARRRA
jgi:hypothetical protein